MGEIVLRAGGRLRPGVAVAVAAALAVAAAATVHALGGPVHRLSVALAASAGVLLVVAGCFRLARWRLRRDAHSGLAGSALVLVGLLVVPARALAEGLTTDASPSTAALALRGAGSLLAMAMLQRALTATELRGLHEPSRLVPVLLVGCGLFFTLSVAAEYAAEARGAVASGDALAGPSLLLAVAWWAQAEILRRHRDERPWAGRVAPLLAGMGVVEALRAAGGQVPSAPTLAAQLLAAVVALAAVRSALADLGAATDESQAAQAELERYESWRRTVRHESRNTCAGLRAALTMFAEPDGTLPPHVAVRLRDAAVSELRSLEAILDPQPAAGSDRPGAPPAPAPPAARASGLAAATTPSG